MDIQQLREVADQYNIEVFYPDSYQLQWWNEDSIDDDDDWQPGWYWWTCVPGCLPESAPTGPFDTEEDALVNATDGLVDGTE